MNITLRTILLVLFWLMAYVTDFVLMSAFDILITCEHPQKNADILEITGLMNAKRLLEEETSLFSTGYIKEEEVQKAVKSGAIKEHKGKKSFIPPRLSGFLCHNNMRLYKENVYFEQETERNGTILLYETDTPETLFAIKIKRP